MMQIFLFSFLISKHVDTFNNSYVEKSSNRATWHKSATMCRDKQAIAPKKTASFRRLTLVFAQNYRLSNKMTVFLHGGISKIHIAF